MPVVRSGTRWLREIIPVPHPVDRAFPHGALVIMGDAWRIVEFLSRNFKRRGPAEEFECPVHDLAFLKLLSYVDG